MAFEFLKKNKKPKRQHYLKEHRFLFIENPFHEVADEILGWGWASWWPAQGAVQYASVKDAAFEAGGACQVTVKRKLLRVGLKGEIIQKKEKRALQIEWRSGTMVGQEFVIVEERSNGTRIDHRIRYKGKSFLHELFWRMFFRKHYQDGIKQAMDALKTHMGE